MLTFSIVSHGKFPSSSLPESSVSLSWFSPTSPKDVLYVLFNSWPRPGFALGERLLSDILSDHSLKGTVGESRVFRAFMASVHQTQPTASNLIDLWPF